MRKAIRVTYHHYKDTQRVYTVEGVEYPTKPNSDRIVVEIREKDSVRYEDVLKNTIITKEYI